MIIPDETDYYELCQEGVMTLLRSLEMFQQVDPLKQVTINRNNLNKGANTWAVFTPSSYTSSKIDAHNKRYSWTMLMDLYIRYKTAEEAPTRFTLARKQILNLLDVHPTLNGVRGVESVSHASRSDLLQDVPGDNPNFVIQTIAVTVIQRVVLKF